MKSKRWHKPFVVDHREGAVYSSFPILLMKGTSEYKLAKQRAEYKFNPPEAMDYSRMPYSLFDGEAQ